MVSPSKKGKLKSKVRDSVAGQSRPSTTGHCQLTRGSKPLIGKKFYLDVKNHVLSSRLEANLKSLGAVVEVFLVKEVHYVVSDRPEWTKEGKVAACSGTGGSGINGPQSGCGSNTPRFSSLSTPAGGTGSESPCTVDSPREVLGKRRVKTRAEAMLVSARQQKQQSTIDPLENARTWKIPIWPVENVFKWIKKIQGSLLLKRPESRTKLGNKPANKFKELKTPYVKLETLDKVSRPSYKELPVWPEINLDCPPGGCPFSVPKTIAIKSIPDHQEKEIEEKKNESSGSSGSPNKKSPKRMTRKPRPVRPSKEGLRAAGAAGYCEICRGEYSDLEKHLKTESHAKFANNDKNFLALDKLISKGPNVDGFLKMNGAKNCSELFGTRRSTRSGVNIHRAWSLDNALTIWKPDEKDDVQDPKENEDNCEKEDVPRRMLVPNGHHNNIQKNLDNHFLQSPKRPRLRLSVDERMTKYGKKDQSVEVVCNGFPDNLQLPPVLKPAAKHEHDTNVRKATPNSKESNSSCRDTGHHLRSRLVPTSEDNANSPELHSRHRRCRNQTEENSELVVTPLSPVNKDAEENTKNNGKLCLDSVYRVTSTLGEGSSKVGVVVKRKRLSVEERLLEDNRGQYGKELVPAKLRSSGYYSVKKEPQENDSAAVSSPPPPTLAADSSASKDSSGWNGALPEADNIVVKPRRAKRTELSLLSVEAESFMFGESASKDENCVPGELEKSERVGQVVELRDYKIVNKFSKGEPMNQNCKTGHVENKKEREGEEEIGLKCEVSHCDESSLASDATDGDKMDGDPLHRRKRRTHAELFIHDNLDYYKFEISEQRLRHGEVKEDDKEETTVENDVNIKQEDLSNDIVEDGNDKAVNESEEEKKSLEEAESKSVKFSFESIPFSEPWYQTYQRQDEGEEIHFTSFSESTAYKPFLMPYESHVDIISKLGFKRAGFQRKRFSGVGKNARKSPRCHASTLAIMSSLMAKRRKENKTHKVVEKEKPVNRVSLPSGSNSDYKSESDKELQDIAKSIEVMLDVSCKDDKVEDTTPVKVHPNKSVQVQLEDIELDLKHLICEDELINYAVNDAVPDVVSLLDSFPDCDCVGLTEEERGAINEAYERGISELNERLNPSTVAVKPRGLPGRPRKRIIEDVEENTDIMDCDSASETVSTCGTVSEVGSHSCKISRKKKRRNRTGWPRQLPKRKKVEFTTGVDIVDSPVVPVMLPKRRGRPRKYPLKEDNVSVKGGGDSETVVSEGKNLKCTKMSTRQSNKDDLLPCTSSSEKLSEGTALKENSVNSCKSSGGDNGLRPNSSPSYSTRSERVSSNRLIMSSPESGVRKFSPLGRRSKIINQNKRESPRKVKPQLGTKWDVWSIRKRR